MTDPSRPRRRNLEISFPDTQNLGVLAIVEAIDAAADRIATALTASVPIPNSTWNSWQATHEPLHEPLVETHHLHKGAGFVETVTDPK
jgi:hypothetical protein